MARPQEHAAAEAAFLHRASTAVIDAPAEVAVPRSPAALWTSSSDTRISVKRLDAVPAHLSEWVAPIVVVSQHA